MLFVCSDCRSVCLGTDVWSYQPSYTFSLPLSTRWPDMDGDRFYLSLASLPYICTRGLKIWAKNSNVRHQTNFSKCYWIISNHLKSLSFSRPPPHMAALLFQDLFREVTGDIKYLFFSLKNNHVSCMRVRALSGNSLRQLCAESAVCGAARPLRHIITQLSLY